MTLKWHTVITTAVQTVAKVQKLPRKVCINLSFFQSTFKNEEIVLDVSAIGNYGETIGFEEQSTMVIDPDHVCRSVAEHWLRISEEVEYPENSQKWSRCKVHSPATKTYAQVSEPVVLRRRKKQGKLPLKNKVQSPISHSSSPFYESENIF